MGPSGLGGVSIDELDVDAYTIPTDAPESDGTLEWSATTIVLVDAHGGDRRGIGYSYTHVAAAALVRDVLAGAVIGMSVYDVPAAWEAMRRRVRNLGRPGLASSAMAAVETALWDLKARLLDIPLASLFGRRREAVDVYGSGGFTSYDERRLCEQLEGWAAQGMRGVKMKIGRQPEVDVERARAARHAIGVDVDLFVDANGAFDPAGALAMAEELAAEADVRWFEEPVTSDDLEGLRTVRRRAPPGMRVAAGEYGYDSPYFRRMLEASAVDVLQADATRCGGYIGFLEAAALCEARAIPLSAHTAPLLHLHVGCAAPRLEHLEYFHDHVRIERMAFEGAPTPRHGKLWPDLGCAGLGVALKRSDLEQYRVA